MDPPSYSRRVFSLLPCTAVLILVFFALALVMVAILVGLMIWLFYLRGG